jgi:hypothetical protein
MGMLTTFGAGEVVEVSLDGETWQAATIYKCCGIRLYQVLLAIGGYHYAPEQRIRRATPPEPVAG